MALRQRLARKLINIGIRLHGPFETEQTAMLPTVPTAHHDAVVEVTDERVDWHPKQHGNVVIAEPDIMAEFRRKKHDEQVPGM
jgi:hypothetical protein